MSQYSDIARFLSNLKDDLRELDSVYHFLQMVQRTYNPAPIVEIFTILKHEDPKIFGYLKQRVQSNPSLKLMIDINIDLQLAKKRIGME